MKRGEATKLTRLFLKQLSYSHHDAYLTVVDLIEQGHRFIAKDSSGDWYAYTNKPYREEGRGRFGVSLGYSTRMPKPVGSAISRCVPMACLLWVDSLMELPEIMREKRNSDLTDLEDLYL